MRSAHDRRGTPLRGHTPEPRPAAVDRHSGPSSRHRLGDWYGRAPTACLAHDDVHGLGDPHRPGRPVGRPAGRGLDLLLFRHVAPRDDRRRSPGGTRRSRRRFPDRRVPASAPRPRPHRRSRQAWRIRLPRIQVERALEHARRQARRCHGNRHREDRRRVHELRRWHPPHRRGRRGAPHRPRPRLRDTQDPGRRPLRAVDPRPVGPAWGPTRPRCPSSTSPRPRTPRRVTDPRTCAA